MNEIDIYLVTMSPKRNWRAALNHYALTVSASSKRAAIEKIPASWPLGDASYRQPEAQVITNGFSTTL